MKTKSKSKTFPQGSDPSEISFWIFDQIEFTNREVIQNTPPDYDIVSESNHKYIVTVTKVNQTNT